MKRKKILLVLKEFREQLFESILEHAQKFEWSIEYHQNVVPSNWYGDGIIIDYFDPSEMKDLLGQIPIATRLPVIQKGVLSIHGDVEHNVKMVFNFFQSRGYRYYSVLSAFPLIPTFDPVVCMQRLVEISGFECHSFYWAEKIRDRKKNDFAEAIKKIKDFLLAVPKPCAVFIGSVQHVHYVYRACEEADIKIPEELAVIANTDDPGFGINLSPPISVLVGEFPKIGKELVDGLDSLIKGKPAPKKIKLIPATNIIVRKSADNYAVSHPQTMQAINYILHNYGDSQLGLREIIQASGCSARTLQRNFVENLTRLPSQFLQDVRLDAAAKLLTKTKLTLNQIAEQVGYGSNMSLSLAFKKKFGATPGKYRKFSPETNA